VWNVGVVVECCVVVNERWVLGQLTLETESLVLEVSIFCRRSLEWSIGV
jgi:hypothetical protein